MEPDKRVSLGNGMSSSNKKSQSWRFGGQSFSLLGVIGLGVTILTVAVTVAIWVNNAFSKLDGKLDRNVSVIEKVCDNQLQLDSNLRLHIIVTAKATDSRVPGRIQVQALPMLHC